MSSYAYEHERAPLLTLDGAAAHLHVSRRTVQRLVADGRLPFIRVSARPLFRVSDLNDFLDSSTRIVAHRRPRGSR